MNDEPITRDELTKVVDKMHDLVLIDKPVPVKPLSRFLVTQCLLEVKLTEGADKRQWIDCLLRVMKFSAFADKSGRDSGKNKAELHDMEGLMQAALAEQRKNPNGQNGAA